MFSHVPLLNTQAALALSVFLLTFAYEDGATLLAVTLGTAGRLDPRLGLASASWEFGLAMLACTGLGRRSGSD